MSFDRAYYSIGRLDRLSYQDTVVHRLDPRTKVLATALFVVTVISYSKYEVFALAPYFLFPAVLVALGDIPALFLLRKVLVVSPFAVFIGIFNPLLDPGTVKVFGANLSAGWISFLSILVKFSLTISAALLLIATTSFPAVCHALRRFGLPALFVSQLLFLYRYLFVLMEEGMRILRAREQRSFGRSRLAVRTAVRIIGALFLRTVERAERIYGAMLARGFSGDMPPMRVRAFSVSDALFLAITAAALLLFRTVPVTELLGRVMREVLG